MNIFVTYTRGNQQRLVRKLRKDKRFTIIEKYENNKLIITTSKKIFEKNKNIIKTIKEFFFKIKYIKEFELCVDVIKDDFKKKSRKIFHIFFDIDSTLTQTGVKTIDKNVKTYFEKFKQSNCVIYFCTGRNYQEVINLNQIYNMGEYGIAESGGIIIGIGRDYRYKLGDIKQPNVVIKYLEKNEIEYKLDPNQKNRLTSFVILKESIKKQILQKAIKNSKANVSLHMAKNTFHITASKIDKGAAINYLVGPKELDLDFELHQTIGVGDSDLDIPMFKHCNDSFSVGDNKTVRRAANHNLRKKAPFAVEELYKKLFKY